MGNCLAHTAQHCCPNSNSLGRGLPTQPTFDYDEIDDLEFDTLLTDPSHTGPYGARGGTTAGEIWGRLAALFRGGRGGPGLGGGSRAGFGVFRGRGDRVPGDGYQAVPGFPRQSASARSNFEDDDAFFGHEEDAQLMDNEQINRITGRAVHSQNERDGGQNLHSSHRPSESPPKSKVSSTLIDISPEPVKAFAEPSRAAESQSNIPAPRALTTFTTFRPKAGRTSPYAAAEAASAFAYAPPVEMANEWEDDDGFGRYQSSAEPAPPAQPTTDAPPFAVSTDSDTESNHGEEIGKEMNHPTQVETIPAPASSATAAPQAETEEASDPLQASFNPTLLAKLSSMGREEFI
ncbi:hypothetical protein HK104_008203 [Borealophlyctis nickersoniae]|nr:hypothetical protein HK104_008203 [Borealophlyctis nickersoniae]